MIRRVHLTSMIDVCVDEARDGRSKPPGAVNYKIQYLVKSSIGIRSGTNGSRAKNKTRCKVCMPTHRFERR